MTGTADPYVIIIDEGVDGSGTQYVIYQDLNSSQRWIIKGKCSHPPNPPCLEGAVEPIIDTYNPDTGRWQIDRLDIPTRPEGCTCDCGLSGEYI